MTENPLESKSKTVNIALKKHYSVREVAELWGVCDNTIIRLFDEEKDVLRLGNEETRYGKKRIVLRIPESAVIRVHAQREKASVARGDRKGPTR